MSTYRVSDKIHTSQAGKQLKQGNETMTAIITINDLDEGASHTIDRGTETEVRSAMPASHPVQSLITLAVANGGEACESYELDGETYTTRVIVSYQ